MNLAGLTTPATASRDPGEEDCPRALMQVRLDGEAIRGAKDADGNQVRLLAALAGPDAATAVVAAQAEVGKKTNEVPMAAVVLGQIDLTGKIVTADALHTVKATANHIHEHGGEFVPARPSRSRPSPRPASPARHQARQTPADLAGYVRGQWLIESLHWIPRHSVPGGQIHCPHPIRASNHGCPQEPRRRRSPPGRTPRRHRSHPMGPPLMREQFRGGHETDSAEDDVNEEDRPPGEAGDVRADDEPSENWTEARRATQDWPEGHEKRSAGARGSGW
jgi:predicted transposase YbfD/YdcC